MQQAAEFVLHSFTHMFSCLMAEKFLCRGAASLAETPATEITAAAKSILRKAYLPKSQRKLARRIRGVQAGAIIRHEVRYMRARMRDPFRNLSRWQRLGIVLSVLWIVGGFLWKASEDGRQAAEFGSLMQDGCMAQKTAAKDFDYKPCLDEFMRGYKLALEGRRGEALEMAFVPVILAWLLAYLILFTGRWVMAGRRSGA